MQATEILRGEHRVIEQVLNCLDRIAFLTASEGRLDADAARQAIVFFRNFADRCHHGKEEHRLFPLLEARGLPRQQGPIGVMLDEHEMGRSLVRELEAALDDHEANVPGAHRRFAHAARAYVSLLREHIAKEDHCLFPMADRFLTEADQDNLLHAFERTEHEEMGTGTHEMYLRIADELADRFDLPRAQTPPVCGCGHAHRPGT